MKKRILKHSIFLSILSISAFVDTVLFYAPWWGGAPETFFDPLFYDRVDTYGLQQNLLSRGITLSLFDEARCKNGKLYLQANEIVIICDSMGILNTVDVSEFQDKLYFISFQPPLHASSGYLSSLKDFFGDRYYIMATDLVGLDGINQVFFPAKLGFSRPNTIDFHKKDFLVMVNSNKYFLDFNPIGSLWQRYSLTSPTSLDFYKKTLIKQFTPIGLKLYGFGWDKEKYPCYQGLIGHQAKDKINLIKHFKFTLCVENTLMPGYITNCLFDPMWAGSVPLYPDFNGAVTAGIPANCFIDTRSFSDISSLITYLQMMSEDEYNSYIKNIDNFLSSNLVFDLFSVAFLATTISGMVFNVNNK